MKRFLILFTLIAFVTVSCAGPNKVRWTGRGSDFRQDKFEEDRKGCIQSIDQDLHSEAFGQALEECLAWQGYKYEPVGSVSSKQVQKKKGEWEKPDFSQVQFEIDREECIQSIDKNLVSEAFGKALEECLAQKGYEYHQVELKPEVNKLTTAKTVLLSAVIITGITLGIALLALVAAVGGAGSALGGLGH